jgi:hypothetical protein
LLDVPPEGLLPAWPPPEDVPALLDMPPVLLSLSSSPLQDAVATPARRANPKHRATEFIATMRTSKSKNATGLVDARRVCTGRARRERSICWLTRDRKRHAFHESTPKPRSECVAAELDTDERNRHIEQSRRAGEDSKGPYST